MAAFLTKHGYSGRRTAAELLTRLRTAPAGTTSAVVSEALRDAVAAIVAMLTALNTAIKDLDRSAAAHLHEHPDGEMFTSFPRAGLINAAQIRAELAEHSAYTGPEAIAALAGLVPVTRASGKHHAVSFRWACNKRLRVAMTTFADNSRHASPWAAGIYRRARASGKDHPHAVRILARAWVRVIWRCWIDQQPYDPPDTPAPRSSSIHPPQPKLDLGVDTEGVMMPPPREESTSAVTMPPPREGARRRSRRRLLRGQLRLDDLEVGRAGSEQFPVPADTDHRAVLQDHDLIGVDDGRHPLSDDHDRACRGDRAQRSPQPGVGGQVQCGERVVEQVDLRPHAPAPWRWPAAGAARPTRWCHPGRSARPARRAWRPRNPRPCAISSAGPQLVVGGIRVAVAQVAGHRARRTGTAAAAPGRSAASSSSSSSSRTSTPSTSTAPSVASNSRGTSRDQCRLAGTGAADDRGGLPGQARSA